ncbi:MAG: outer membrane protein assembly factor BamA, partial [Pseudomonadota bacterium]
GCFHKVRSVGIFTVRKFRAIKFLLACVLLLLAVPASAQTRGTVSFVTVSGNQRIEADTVRSYVGLSPGDGFNDQVLDRALKRLFGTGLFADVQIRPRGGQIDVTVVENPIINRVVFEGNRRIEDDEMREEVRLRPRTVYTRAKVQADVQRIIELYRRSGRFATTVEPKVVQLEQNRVDLVFEINEGDKTGVRRINFIGNRVNSDRALRGEIVTKENRFWRFFSSNDTYDPDRLAFDRELLRQYYLSTGYADFRVTSAVAELTPDRRDFFITFVVEEGEVYEFGDISVASEIRDLDSSLLENVVLAKSGRRYDARLIEDTREAITNIAGVLGYAFVDVRPEVRRDREKRTLNIVFRVLEAPRVYVERINIFGNTRTLESVVRREFRLSEGDAFNTALIERSKQRIRRLGFFQDELEVEQIPGSGPDKVVLAVNLEERATGQLSLGAGFSSVDNFLINFSIRNTNLLGRGQDLRLGLNLSGRRRSIDLGFTEPYFLGRNLAAGFDFFLSEIDNVTESAFEQSTIGGQLRAGFPVTERLSLGLRYTLRRDSIEIPASLIPTVSPILAASLGDRVTSSIGYSLIYDSRNSAIRPTRGQRLVFSQEFAGLGGDERFLRTRLDYDFFKTLRFLERNWILRLGTEAGFIEGIGEDVEINNNFFLGSPRFRGFDIRGVGPRALNFDPNGILISDEALGGRAFYLSSAELEIPLGETIAELGVRASAFVDVGSLFSLDVNPLVNVDASNIVADTPTPRVTVGIGFSWRSPFGPFRIDLGRAIISEEFDETEFFQFNVGTQF